MNFNVSVIEGILTNDPVIKNKECSFIIESKCEYNKVEKIINFNIVTNNNLAQNCFSYLRKNSRVLCSGKLLKDKNNNVFIDTTEVNFLIKR